MPVPKPLTIACAAVALLTGCERGGSDPGAKGGPIQVAPLASPGGRAPDSFAPIVKRVSPAVVSIDTLSVTDTATPWLELLPPGAAGATPVRRGAGSGFLISADGYVVTNNHVVEGATDVVVSLADGRQFPARIIGRDPPTDLAVVKVEARDLPYVSFASSALPQVGDWVVAVGNPFGLGGTATAGIVSAQGREIGETYVGYLQIDAPINSGNSGGPSFDLQGRVVGVNSAIFSPSGGSVGIGFAIPSDLAERVTLQLIREGRVTRGYVGVGAQDLTPTLAMRLDARGRRGAVIVEVDPKGPAGGRLKPGDVVTAIDDAAIASAGGLLRAIAAAAPGQQVTLQVLRRGQPQTVAVRAARRAEER
jgi:serine protease Do